MGLLDLADQTSNPEFKESGTGRYTCSSITRPLPTIGGFKPKIGVWQFATNHLGDLSLAVGLRNTAAFHGTQDEARARMVAGGSGAR